MSAHSTHSPRYLEQRGIAVLGKFILTDDIIGTGSSGKVKLAIDPKTLERYACKEFTPNDGEASIYRIKRETKIMTSLSHPNIVSLVDVHLSYTKCFLVMELVSGGELLDQIQTEKRFDEPTARYYYRQLLAGLSHCHRRGIYHRDLKPENLLVDTSGVLKISDFGTAALTKNDISVHKSAELAHSAVLNTICGTPHYLAPEVIKGKGKGYSGSKIDLWASGIILYTMLTGTLPFDGDIDTVLHEIAYCQVPIPPNLSNSAADLLKHVLERNPRRRYSNEQIMAHHWMNEPTPKQVVHKKKIHAVSDLAYRIPESLPRDLKAALYAKDQEQRRKELLRAEAELECQQQQSAASQQNFAAPAAARSATLLTPQMNQKVERKVESSLARHQSAPIEQRSSPRPEIQVSPTGSSSLTGHRASTKVRSVTHEQPPKTPQKSNPLENSETSAMLRSVLMKLSRGRDIENTEVPAAPVEAQTIVEKKLMKTKETVPSSNEKRAALIEKPRLVEDESPGSDQAQVFADVPFTSFLELSKGALAESNCDPTSVRPIPWFHVTGGLDIIPHNAEFGVGSETLNELWEITLASENLHRTQVTEERWELVGLDNLTEPSFVPIQPQKGQKPSLYDIAVKNEHLLVLPTKSVLRPYRQELEDSFEAFGARGDNESMGANEWSEGGEHVSERSWKAEEKEERPKKDCKLKNKHEPKYMEEGYVAESEGCESEQTSSSYNHKSKSTAPGVVVPQSAVPSTINNEGESVADDKTQVASSRRESAEKKFDEPGEGFAVPSERIFPRELHMEGFPTGVLSTFGGIAPSVDRVEDNRAWWAAYRMSFEDAQSIGAGQDLMNNLRSEPNEREVGEDVRTSEEWLGEKHQRNQIADWNTIFSARQEREVVFGTELASMSSPLPVVGRAQAGNNEFIAGGDGTIPRSENERYGGRGINVGLSHASGAPSMSRSDSGASRVIGVGRPGMAKSGRTIAVSYNSLALRSRTELHSLLQPSDLSDMVESVIRMWHEHSVQKLKSRNKERRFAFRVVMNGSAVRGRVRVFQLDEAVCGAAFTRARFTSEKMFRRFFEDVCAVYQRERKGERILQRKDDERGSADGLHSRSSSRMVMAYHRASSSTSEEEERARSNVNSNTDMVTNSWRTGRTPESRVAPGASLSHQSGMDVISAGGKTWETLKVPGGDF